MKCSAGIGSFPGHYNSIISEGLRIYRQCTLQWAQTGGGGADIIAINVMHSLSQNGLNTAHYVS